MQPRAPIPNGGGLPSSTGASWARIGPLAGGGPLPGVPPVLAFHSIKGGVGRSTAVAVLAAHQAERGRNVLVVDLDLEAPGIGALLLAQEDLPQLGILDWLVETSLRPDAEGELIQRCVGQSQLTRGRGAVDVLPALGRSAGEAPWTVVPKLGRGFIDHPGLGHSHLERVRRLVDLACSEGTRTYDAVLVDAPGRARRVVRRRAARPGRHGPVLRGRRTGNPGRIPVPVLVPRGPRRRARATRPDAPGLA